MDDTRQRLPDDPELSDDAKEALRLFGQGLACTEEGLLEKAAEAYVRCLELFAANGSAWFNLGLVYKLLKRWDDSLRCNQKAVELDPKNEGAWCRLL